ncbi:MAG: hypothetical protein GX601_07680, partial [Anaerolineales bacterium]|nr:hypothetical protein [Anaerolineales bacterium]
MSARDRYAIVTLILVALAVAGPLWGPGIVNTRGGGDSPFLLQRTHQMVANLRAGVFPVRWMPDAAYGLGYPFFSYYSSLPYYLASGLVLLGLDMLAAIKAVQTLGFIAAALAMYGLVRRVTGNRWAAWLAGVAYTVAPFHLVNVFVRGDSLSEFYAFVFYPLVIWGLDAVACRRNGSTTGRRARGSRVGLLWPALAYAGLIASHNISALIFSPFILLYPLLTGRRGRAGGAGIAGCYLSLVWGLLLSAWIWAPALAEKSLVQTAALTDDYFHYSHHFRTLDLVQRGLLFDYSVAPGRDSPFAMGLVQAAFGVMGVAALVVRGLRSRHTGTHHRGWWVFVLVGLAVSTAMITPLSEPLWRHLPLLPMIQFPWRFLSVQAFFVAAATAALLPARGRWCWVGLPVAALLVVAVLVPLAPDRLPISSADVTVERLGLYELFTQNIGTTIRYEWLPLAAVPRPFTSGVLIDGGLAGQTIPLDGAQIEAVLLERGVTRQTWRVQGEGGALALPVLYWPGWQAQVDGDQAPVWATEGSGLLTLNVPPGEHEVLVWLGHTPVRLIAEIVSLVALVAWLGWLAAAWRGVRWRTVLRGVGVILVPCVVFLVLPQRYDFSADDLSMDFDQAPYLHHAGDTSNSAEGIPFDAGVRLLRYDFSADELSPGEALTLTCGWSGLGNDHTVTARLVAPAALRYEVEPLAEVVAQGDAAAQQIRLLVPNDTYRGIYLVQLTVEGPEGELRARTPGGQSRGVLYLRAVRVTPAPSLPADASVLAPFGSSIRLHEATVNPLGAGRLGVRLAWSTSHPLAANYGISLRIVDGAGSVFTQFDSQPGYGYLPTMLWRPGEWIVDRYILHAPEDVACDGGCQLAVILYQVATGQPVGQASLGSFALPLEETFEARRPSRTFVLPSLPHTLGVTFDEQLRLAGYELAQEANSLRLTLWWQALEEPQEDYTVFVHLFDPDSEEIASQSDAMPRTGAYPTSWWSAGEVVSETIRLPLTDVPAGAYRMALGLY